MQADRVKITLRGTEEPSGLAMMFLQYFEQNVRDFPEKNRQARKINGKLAIEALEGNVGVTVNFKNEEIEITDGCASENELFVRGGIFALTELAAGGTGALGKIASREIKLHSAWKHPLFAFRVARFMSLPREMKSRGASARRGLWWKLAVGAAGAIAATGLAAYFLAD